MIRAHLALQRVVTRLLYDPGLVDQVHLGLDLPELDKRAMGWIRAVPRGAWGADPYRRSRSLQALLEEFPVSAAVATQQTGSVRALDAFFSSEAFHSCIQGRRSLALSFGEWIGRFSEPVSRLESAFACVRRPTPAIEQGWRLAPGFEPVNVPVGTVRRYLSIRAHLGASPVVVLAGESPLPQALDPIGSSIEALLIERAPDGDVSIGHATEALNALLETARVAQPIEAFFQKAVALGAETEEARNIVRDLIEDRLIEEVFP